MAAQHQAPAGRVPRCPACGVLGRIAEIDLADCLWPVLGIGPAGPTAWDDPQVDWSSLRPADTPPRFICLACRGRFAIEAIIAASQPPVTPRRPPA